MQALVHSHGMADELAKIAWATERTHVVTFLPANPTRPTASCATESRH
jgi:hypothetical protein